MSNETKRDVFGKMKWELIRNLANTIDQNGGLRPLEDATKVGTNYAKRYVAALPDDLPVIPKAVSEYIRKAKAKEMTISDVFWRCVLDHGELENWINKHDEIVARAWVLGAWHVEETGEIVKLESEE